MDDTPPKDIVLYVDSAVEAINRGHVFSYIQKPWDDEMLKAQIRSALNRRKAIFWLNHLPDLLATEITENPKENRVVRKLAEAVNDELEPPTLILAGPVRRLQALGRDDGRSILPLYFKYVILNQQIKRPQA